MLRALVEVSPDLAGNTGKRVERLGMAALSTSLPRKGERSLPR